MPVQRSPRTTSITSRADASPAPPWEVVRWFNAAPDFGLESLRGRVVVLHAFQMLCPGCVLHGIPQAQRIAGSFAADDVQVVGLHTVFEHHEAMNPEALQAFLHEYRIGFPVGVDAPSESGPTPKTMARYGLRGTPSLLLIDRGGHLRWHTFGRPEDMAVGAAIATLVSEPRPDLAPTEDVARAFDASSPTTGCADGTCELGTR